MFPSWNWTLIAIAVSFHSVAILFTLFRLWYRWYIARLWWDDGWATLALLADIAWLVVAILEQPVTSTDIPRFFTIGNWIVSFGYPTLMWTTRLSILTSVVRVLHPEGMQRRITLSIGVLFGIMGVAMLGQRLQVCLERACLMTRALLMTQTTTDCIADATLSALPLWFLRSMNLSRNRKILIASTLSASMVINVLTITQAVVLFQCMTSGSIIFEHVRVACSVIVCNLFVIVTFVYRVLHSGKPDLEASILDTSKVIELTTIDFAEGGLSQDTSKVQSLSVPTARSSTWSFKGGSRSKTSTEVSKIWSEAEHSQVGQSRSRDCPVSV